MMRGRFRAGTLIAAGVLSITANVAQARAVTVSLPAGAGAPPGSSTTVPLSISSATGVLGSDIVITFDATVATVQSVSKTTLSAPHTLTTNLSTPGVVLISLFGATALSGGGVLLNITFRSGGPTGSQTPLLFQTLLLNEGQIPATASDGRYCVQGRPDEVQDLEIGQTTPSSPAVLLSWGPVPYALGYNVYRGGSPDLADLGCFLPFVGSTSTMDDGAVPAPGGLFVFLVTAVNCSEESTLGFASSGLERTASSRCL